MLADQMYTDAYHVPPGVSLLSNILIISNMSSAFSAAAAAAPDAPAPIMATDLMSPIILTEN